MDVFVAYKTCTVTIPRQNLWHTKTFASCINLPICASRFSRLVWQSHNLTSWPSHSVEHHVDTCSSTMGPGNKALHRQNSVRFQIAENKPAFHTISLNILRTIQIITQWISLTLHYYQHIYHIFIHLQKIFCS